MSEKTSGEAPKSRAIVAELPANKSMEAVIAELAASPIPTSAAVTVDFASGAFGEVSLMEAIGVLTDKVAAVKRGDLGGVEATLTAQAVALNSIFGEMARRSAANMGRQVDVCERYMRLALKAQNQCRATLETLAEIKNPPVVIARQANFAAGPQQVNNGIATPASAPAGKKKKAQNKLLESDDGKRLDPRAKSQTIRVNPAMAAMGAVDGAADG